MSAYDRVAGGSLKLKGVSDAGIKKKKKKSKNKEKEKRISDHILTESSEKGESVPFVDRRTKAEIAFEKVKEKRSAEELLEKASKSHKERIMDFNEKLSNLTEHYDIPKVSWTK